LDSRWLGPGDIVERRSKRGYAVRVKEGFVIDAPLVFLKAYIPDVYSGFETLMHFHKRTPQNLEEIPEELQVESIVGHKNLSNGSWRFLTKWCGDNEETWEPISTFISTSNTNLIDYCREHHVNVDLISHL
jgi:hypothetical protein